MIGNKLSVQNTTVLRQIDPPATSSKQDSTTGDPTEHAVLHEVVPLLPTELSMQDTRDWKIPFHSNVHAYWIHVVRKDHNLVVMAKLIEKLICEGPFHHLPSQSSVMLEMKNDL